MTDVLGRSLARAGKVELRMDALPENLVLARLALGGLAVKAGIPEEEVADLKLAVTEACTNAIEHAYVESAGADEILVRYELDRDLLTVEVQDWGVGFDPDVDRLDGDGDRDHAGVGLMLIRSLSDELTITSGPSGSLVAFTKQLSSAS